MKSTTTSRGTLALFLLLAGTQHSSAQALVPNLGAGGPQLAVLVEEVSRNGAPTGAMMMFPATPAPLSPDGLLPISGVIGNYTIDLTVSLTTDPAPGVVISGSPGTITKTGEAPTRLHLTIDGGLSSPQGANTLGHLAFVGSVSGQCGLTLTAAAGYAAGGGDIAWTAFPSGIYPTRYHADDIADYRLNQPIRQAGVVALRTFLSADISTMGDTLTLPSSIHANIGVFDATPNSAFNPKSFNLVATPGTSILDSLSLSDLGSFKIGIQSVQADTFNTVLAIADLREPSNLKGHVVSSPDVLYQINCSGLLGLLWTGRGQAKTVRRDWDWNFVIGAIFDFDQLYYKETTDEVIGVSVAEDSRSFGVASYLPSGVPTGGWTVDAPDGYTFTGASLDWEDGSSELSIAADATDGVTDAVMSGQLGGPIVRDKRWVWSTFRTQSDDRELLKQVAGDPRSPASATDFGNPVTMVGQKNPATGALEKVWKVVGISSYKAHSAAGGAIVMGGTRTGRFGEDEITAHLDSAGTVTFLDHNRLFGPGGGNFQLRHVDGNIWYYLDLTLQRVACVEVIAVIESLVDAKVSIADKGTSGLFPGPYEALVGTVTGNEFNFTNDPASSPIFSCPMSVLALETTATAIDLTESISIEPATEVVTPWTPGPDHVSFLTEAVDRAVFSGGSLDGDLSPLVGRCANEDRLKFGVELGGPDSIIFSWQSTAGKVYDIHYNSDPNSGSPEAWAILPGGAGIEATPPRNTHTSEIDFEDVPTSIHVVIERDAP